MILFARFLRVGADKIQNTAAHKLRCFFVVGCICGANLHARQTSFLLAKCGSETECRVKNIFN